MRFWGVAIVKGGEEMRFSNIRLKRYYPLSSGGPRRGCLLFIIAWLSCLSEEEGELSLETENPVRSLFYRLLRDDSVKS